MAVAFIECARACERDSTLWRNCAHRSSVVRERRYLCQGRLAPVTVSGCGAGTRVGVGTGFLAGGAAFLVAGALVPDGAFDTGGVATFEVSSGGGSSCGSVGFQPAGVWHV